MTTDKREKSFCSQKVPKRNDYIEVAKSIADFLRQNQLSTGAIYDRTEGMCSPDDSYGPSNFALLAAQLFKVTGDKSWIEPMRRAMLYYLNLLEKQPQWNSIGYRDFNDIAILEAYELVRDFLPENERNKWKNHLRTCPRPTVLRRMNHWTAIYCTFYRLGQIFQREEDCHWAQQCMRELILPAFAPDGFWCDHVGKKSLFVKGAYWPMAYHPFNLVYLYRYILASDDQRARQIFLKALDATVGLIAPDGDFNALGRDQESNFSYSSLVYVYEAGAYEVADKDPEKATLYREVVRRAWAWLQQYLCSDGYFRVKPNDMEHLRGGYDDYENNVDYAALSAIHLMWAAEVCQQEVVPKGSIPADTEGYTWLKDSGFIFAHVGDLMILAGRGCKNRLIPDRRSIGMVPGFLKLNYQGRVIDLIPTPGGGTPEVLYDWLAHPRTGLLPYFLDESGRIGHLWEADQLWVMGETDEGIRVFGEGEIIWTCDGEFKKPWSTSGIRQRRLLVFSRKAGLLIFDEFLSERLIDRDIRWVPYNISFLGEPWRNDAQYDYVVSTNTKENIRLVYAVPAQKIPFRRVTCSPYLSSKGPAYYFAVQEQPYIYIKEPPVVLASRLAVQEISDTVSPSIDLIQVTQDHSLAVYLADIDKRVAVNFAEETQEIRAADISWKVKVEAHGVKFF